MRKLYIFAFLILIVTTTNSQSYYLNGNATAIGGDCYQLTPFQSNKYGTVWHADQIDLTQPFNILFTMNFGFLDSNGADGMCFVLQDIGTNAIGENGGGMGYQSFGTSLGIEFDTYRNSGFNDPTYDHIGIQINGEVNHNAPMGVIAGPVQASATSVNIEDGQDHLVRITWNPETHFIQVFFDCEFRLEGEVDLINNVFGGENLVYWGFTAATGGSYNIHKVCLREDILNQSEVTICQGTSTQLEAAGSIDNSYTWTPNEYINNTNSSTPTVNPPVTTIYTASFLDACGDHTETKITVNVENLEINIDDIPMLNCESPSAQIHAETNASDNTLYTWSLDGSELQSGNNLSSITVDTPGSYSVSADIGNGCTANYDFEVEGNFTTYEVSLLTDHTTLNCYNNQTQITAQVNGSGDISWKYNNSGIVGVAGTNLTVEEAGTYTASITHPASGCISEGLIIIHENFDAPTIQLIEQEQLNCIQTNITLMGILVNSNEEYSVHWSTQDGTIESNANTLTPTLSAIGLYTLIAKNMITGCETQDNIQITGNYATPEITAGVQEPMSCTQTSMELADIFVFSENSFSISWTVNSGNLSGGVQSLSPTVTSPGVYILTVIDEFTGCASQEVVIVEPADNSKFDIESLVFPNIITPNGDALNVSWKPYLGIDPTLDISVIFRDYNLKIFDRWGRLRYESNNYSEQWTATEVEDGTYFYILNFQSSCQEGIAFTKQGHLQVAR